MTKKVNIRDCINSVIVQVNLDFKKFEPTQLDCLIRNIIFSNEF